MHETSWAICIHSSPYWLLEIPMRPLLQIDVHQYDITGHLMRYWLIETLFRLLPQIDGYCVDI